MSITDPQYSPGSFIDELKKYCLKTGSRLTGPRLYVMEIIAASEKPLVAYEILERLGDKLPNPKPPTAYRAINFLITHGFIHRIESLNAYTVCQIDHRHRGSQFMVCDSCGAAKEIHLCSLPHDIRESLDAGELKFYPAFWNLEIHGTCTACAE